MTDKVEGDLLAANQEIARLKRPMQWQEICDLISKSANAAHNMESTEADGLRSEMQFLENIASYCTNEAQNVQDMLDDHLAESDA